MYKRGVSRICAVIAHLVAGEEAEEWHPRAVHASRAARLLRRADLSLALDCFGGECWPRTPSSRIYHMQKCAAIASVVQDALSPCEVQGVRLLPSRPARGPPQCRHDHCSTTRSGTEECPTLLLTCKSLFDLVAMLSLDSMRHCRATSDPSATSQTCRHPIVICQSSKT